ncbi:MAG TPA: hypothetical protein VGO11_11395 [Chthoniobacteraceae bacterium]|jgi:hypothetical protein|nr:hypothetical protein [Chthoniobacteraceae bacterium]
MKFFLLLPFLVAAFPGGMKADPAALAPSAVAGPKDALEALISYFWSYEDFPKHTGPKSWTRLQFYVSGRVTAYHFGTPLKTIPWELSGPRTLRIEDAWYTLDEGFTKIESWSPSGSIVKRATREAATTPAAAPSLVPAPVAQVPKATPTPGSPAPAGPTSLEILREQGPNIMNWTMAPIDVALPAGFRDNVTQLREGLLDEAAKGSRANPAACQAGARFCDNLLAALSERETKISQAQASWSVHSSGTLGAHRADLNTNGQHLPILYNSNWPVYLRERAETGDRKKQASNLDDFFNASAKAHWNDRTTQLRRTAETLYEQFRAAARQVAR